MLKRILPIIFICLDFAGAAAQQPGMEVITPGDGLSQGYISCLLQDKEGFIWAGTKNGLNRYDGYRFEVFTHDPYDSYSLSGDFITTVAEYGSFLIVGTAVTGINIFHKNTRRSYRITAEELSPGNRDLFVKWCEPDFKGNIWVDAFVPGQPDQLYQIVIPDGFWQYFPNKKDDRKPVIVRQLTDVQMDGLPHISRDKTQIFVVADVQHVLIRMNTASSDTIILPLPARVPHPDIFPTQKWTWLSADYNGKPVLFRLDNSIRLPKPGDWEQITTPSGFSRLYAVESDRIWLQAGEKISAYKTDEQQRFNPASPVVSGIQLPAGHGYHFIDRSGLHWIGTQGLGLVKINLRPTYFKHFFEGKSISGPIFQDHSGRIFSYDNYDHLLFHPDGLPAALSSLARSENNKIVQDAGGNYWALGKEPGTHMLFLDKINSGGQRKRFAVPESGYWQHAMTIGTDGNLWIGINGSLLRFDVQQEKFSSFSFKAVLPEPHTVFALSQAGGNTWWIATNKGLIKGNNNPQGFDFQLFKNDPANRNSLRSNHLLALLHDPADENVLWIGTNGGGLNRLDTRTLQFSHLTTREGLPNDVIYAVLPDETGHLWLSSNRGIIRYTPATGHIKQYTREDGLQDNEFNTWAYGKSADGNLFLGGVNGINMFRPDDLQDNQTIPPVHITSLRLNDRQATWGRVGDVLAEAPEFTGSVVVPYDKNNITLDFVALDYAIPSKNRFRYYLEGAEKEWAHESTGNNASYLNLEPGEYTFRVMGCNSDGVWNETPATLKITILPPWYRSWWAWLTYLILAGSGVWLLYRYQLRRKLEQAEHIRLKELDAFKSRFFTNVTHEFRTPLTVILGTTEQLDKTARATGGEEVRLNKQKFSHQIDLIRRNGANLLRLINEILDLAKLERKTLKMNYIQGDVLAWLRYITESLHSLANSQNVMLRVESDQAKIMMDYDPERLLQIVHNLLSNAIRFTPSGGRVVLRANVDNTQGSSRLIIQVTDNGAGIPTADLPHIFERFYQAGNQSQGSRDLTERTGGGTGIGLSLTRELVRMAGGEITAASTPGENTTFTIILPITNQAPLEDNSPAAAPSVAESMPAPVKNNEDGDTAHLLIIEDNPDVVEYLSGFLTGFYQTTFAYNGRVGVEKALETIPDLIISDVMMPEMDGFEVCDALKNDERTSHIPVIILTARATVEDRIAGLRRGADAYLAKPFHPEELLATLDNLLRQRERLQLRYAAPFDPSAPAEQGLRIEDAFLKKVLAVIEKHLQDSEFEMPQLERALGMSRSQIFRKVKALTGLPPTLFIRSVRLHKAKELLRTTDLTVAEIAYSVGFGTPSYFSTAFLEAFGKTPGDFRG